MVRTTEVVPIREITLAVRDETTYNQMDGNLSPNKRRCQELFKLNDSFVQVDNECLVLIYSTLMPSWKQRIRRIGFCIRRVCRKTKKRERLVVGRYAWRRWRCGLFEEIISHSIAVFTTVTTTNVRPIVRRHARIDGEQLAP